MQVPRLDIEVVNKISKYFVLKRIIFIQFSISVLPINYKPVSHNIVMVNH